MTKKANSRTNFSQFWNLVLVIAVQLRAMYIYYIYYNYAIMRSFRHIPLVKLTSGSISGKLLKCKHTYNYVKKLSLLILI